MFGALIFLFVTIYTAIEFHFSRPGWTRRVWTVNGLLAFGLALSYLLIGRL